LSGRISGFGTVTNPRAQFKINFGILDEWLIEVFE
jgi:hypothetical protein